MQNGEWWLELYEIIYMHCRDMKKWDISDPRNYEHYWTNSWNETWKKNSDSDWLTQVYGL